MFWRNRGLVVSRYCEPMAVLLERVVSSCGCDVEDWPELARDELTASCEYHLVSGIPRESALSVDEGALDACMERLRARLVGCTHARLPVECELDRIFDVEASRVPALSQPAGEPCRRTNGDEGFDAHFVCAEGLRCASRCVSEACDGPSGCEPPRCGHPLDLPWAGP